MNIISSFLIFVVVLADFVSSFDSKCPPLRLVSGRSRYRGRGRSVRFNCMRGFQLVGVKYATCMNGKWDADVPICVKYGCQAPSTTHVNGQFIESYRGAVVKIVCNPGYTLIGSPSVYCNGIRWNETFPVCRVKNTNPALSCNFEESDLCGWTQDPMHDFDWKRQNGTSGGPVFDHTKGENNTGHYMYMESSSLKLENDTARLYSPVYPPEFSNGSCFTFWYHMNGAGTGYLKVYVKPEGIELYNLIPSFWIYGDQGTSWLQSFFPVIPTTSPFQIVIEGMRGPGIAGDTAFDDVKLTTLEECKTLEEMTSSTEFSSSVNPDDDVIDYFSCKNRCSQEKGNGSAGILEDEKCNCYDSCDKDGTCCSDYFDFCVAFPSTSTTEQTDLKTSSPPSSTTPEPEEKLPSTKPTPRIQHYNNESNEIVPGKPFLEVTTPKTTTKATTTSKATPKTTTTSKATPKTTTTSKATPKATTTKKTTLQPPPSKPETELKTTTKTIQRKIPNIIEKKLPKPTTNRTKVVKIAVIENETGNRKKKPELGKNTTMTSSIKTTTEKPFKSSKPNNIKLTFLDKPSSPNLSNESRFSKGRQKEVSGKDPPQAIKIDKHDDKSNGKMQRIVQFGGSAIAVLIVVIIGLVWYKRRENRKSERENMVEDSDVRFLTSDEALDFTLARPADDDL